MPSNPGGGPFGGGANGPFQSSYNSYMHIRMVLQAGGGLRLALGVAAVDIWHGSQGTDALHANWHAMGGAWAAAMRLVCTWEAVRRAGRPMPEPLESCKAPPPGHVRVTCRQLSRRFMRFKIRTHLDIGTKSGLGDFHRGLMSRAMHRTARTQWMRRDVTYRPFAELVRCKAPNRIFTRGLLAVDEARCHANLVTEYSKPEALVGPERVLSVVISVVFALVVAPIVGLIGGIAWLEFGGKEFGGAFAFIVGVAAFVLIVWKSAGAFRNLLGVIRSKLQEPARSCVQFALSGGLLFGGVMLTGIFLLGHTRPIGWDFDHVLPSMAFGSAVFLVCGLPVGIWRKRRLGSSPEQ